MPVDFKWILNWSHHSSFGFIENTRMTVIYNYNSEYYSVASNSRSSCFAYSHHQINVNKLCLWVSPWDFQTPETIIRYTIKFILVTAVGRGSIILKASNDWSCWLYLKYSHNDHGDRVAIIGVLIRSPACVIYVIQLNCFFFCWIFLNQLFYNKIWTQRYLT